MSKKKVAAKATTKAPAAVTKVTIENLTEAVKDLNKVLKLDPAIPVENVTQDALENEVRGIFDEIKPTDALSAATWVILNLLGSKTQPKAAAAPAPAKATPAAAKAPAATKGAAKAAPAAKGAKATTPKGAVRAAYRQDVSEMIEKAKYNRTDIIATIRKAHPSITESAVGTYLSDLKNPKYNQGRLVYADDKGVLSYNKPKK